MKGKTIRLTQEHYDRLKAIDEIPDRAIGQLLGAQNSVVTKVINTMLSEVRTIVKEELEKVKS
jgi:hypothetical protein